MKAASYRKKEKDCISSNSNYNMERSVSLQTKIRMWGKIGRIFWGYRYASSITPNFCLKSVENLAKSKPAISFCFPII